MRQALLLAVATACKTAIGAGQPAALPEPIRLIRFDTRVAGFSEYSGYADSARLVVRDAVAWRRAWGTLNSGKIPQPALPAVDFDRETVLIAAMGRQPSGGFEITLDSAAQRAGYVEVSVRSTRPGGQCFVSAVFTNPVDVARIPASPLPVRFREQNRVVACSWRGRDTLEAR